MAWLLGLALDEAVLSTAGRARELVAGSATERAIEKALRNACQVVALELVDRSGADEAAAVLLEHLIGSAPAVLPAGSPLSTLEAAVSEAVSVLWAEESVSEAAESTHAEAIELRCTAEELVALLVDELIRSLGVVSAVSPIGTLVALLGTERNRRDIAELREAASTTLVRVGSEVQATRVNAWIAVNDDVPIVYVMNDSDGPIFDTRPTPALIGYGSNGEISAQVGHTPLGVVRQIDPRSGWAWPMNHCPGWGGVPYVKGQLHVNFRDAAGYGWLLGHDQLVPARDPWEAPPNRG